MPYVLDFKEIDRTKVMTAGGKGANLGELSKIEGICVPEGFCITAEAFKRVVIDTPSVNQLIHRLAMFGMAPQEEGIIDDIDELCREIREAIEKTVIPKDIEEEIVHNISRLGEEGSYAVRSSATAEDLPAASFAGQQDTYLNVIGKESILKHIVSCWASLFTERAVSYRIKNDFDHRKVHMSVVVQRMVYPQASGIMFTADPVSGNRKVLTIDAGFGLGEAMVSGTVNADVYKVREGEVTDKKVALKKKAVYAVMEGGTKEQELDVYKQNVQVLMDSQILELESIGRKIEKHFGYPQDIEWCLADDVFYIVQSRPITTLYPVPEVHDQEKHVYISVGHQQMMTDPMKPLGMSIYGLTSVGTRYTAGGRFFVDVMGMLSSPDSREVLINNMGNHDPLIKDAIVKLIERGDFIKSLQDNGSGKGGKAAFTLDFKGDAKDDRRIASDMIKYTEASVTKLKEDIQGLSGTEQMDFILSDIEELKKILFHPDSMKMIYAAADAILWINKYMDEWLGEKNAADVLSQSVQNNVTSEMGLELLDLADVIRPYPEIINYLRYTSEDSFLDELYRFDGGKEVRDAFAAFLSKYGMRCAGEIDVTKSRWSEKPTALIPVVLSNVKNFKHGEGRRKFEQGYKEALDKEKELIERLKQLPDGEQKAKDTKRVIDILRSFSGFREYPKYGMINRYFVYKKALMKEADKLLESGTIDEKEDIYYLTFEELREAILINKAEHNIIRRRKEEYRWFEKLTPPRVITSDGEIITGNYKRENLPEGAIVGLAVSSGTVEGRARVIMDMKDANLEEGDILVTIFTDPSWTPLFISAKGLVTEVGGMMTHGAVIAREYGLPAVVGVENATRLIKDGQRIRVNGTEGYVEIL